MYRMRRYVFRIGTYLTTCSLFIIIINSFFTPYDTFFSSTDSIFPTTHSFQLETLEKKRQLTSSLRTSISSSTSLKSSISLTSTLKLPVENSSSTPAISETYIPDIFDLTLWRHAIIGAHGNQTLCRVPKQYRPIANAVCHALGRTDCFRIPCTLVHISDEFTQNIECLRGGKLAVRVKPDWICRKSAALEILSNPNRKPSIQAEAYTPLTSELYSQALAPYRDKDSKWGLTLEGESIGYYPSMILKTRLLSLFDITVGYDRRIFDVISDLYLLDYADLLINRSKRLTVQQVLSHKVPDHAPILWMNSNCDTPSNRTGYMLELMRYIRVDVRGKCGNPNWDNSSLTNTDPKVLARDKLIVAGEYLFTVAIENTLAHDYVTEKLWQPLAAGSVPLYLGAPNIDEWLPCKDTSCIVDLRKFKSPVDLANYLQPVIDHRYRYMHFHQWRRKLKSKTSFVKMIDYFKESNQYTVECLLCDMIHRKDQGATRAKLLANDNPFNSPFPSLI
ncbi:unnamed protein product [Adineta steineri]|uniref:Fucosyltransferase n=1 Tax=Adineta steineri TaxID=433720 RepID=A0A818LP12_9BILA|nr:unnamed protein product [Adineta steineri]CAF3581476.1 unnamed protein product [Adineta steineri]